MGNGMNKVLPGLYVGNYRDSKDPMQLDKFNITHILSIHDSPRRLHPDKHYLCVMAADTADQNLSQYFSVCNDFIHGARLKEGCVLIHCLAGMSRSVSVCVAYIMSATQLSFQESLKVVRAGRHIANPNPNFQNQLQDFELYKLEDERRRLKERYPNLALHSTDLSECNLALHNYERLLSTRDICEGRCRRGESCPTGVCRNETSKNTARRKSSNTSNATLTTQSCPSSPRFRQDMKNVKRTGDYDTHSLNYNNTSNTNSYNNNNDSFINERSNLSALQRSSTIVSASAFRPRGPRGIFSYTGSAPSSLHGSRVDLAGSSRNNISGSAIYLGCSSGNKSSALSSSKLSLHNDGQSAVSAALENFANSQNRSSPTTISKSPRRSPRR